MKKTAAMLGSVFFYVGMFILSLLLLVFTITHDLRWFILGFPPVIAAYFVIAGNIFVHQLHLSRWVLWLGMNLIGGLCSWVILLICFPALLYNGFVFVLIVPLAAVFAVVWAAVGIGFLVVNALQRRRISNDRML